MPYTKGMNLPGVVVVGSVNVDLVIRMPHLPRPGETTSQRQI